MPKKLILFVGGLCACWVSSSLLDMTRRDVRFYPNGGPAVGPGIHPQPRPAGQNFEAATWKQSLGWLELY